MLRVFRADARPGMILAMPLFHPRRQGAVLLQAGVTLDQRTIERLGDLGVAQLWINYPGTESIMRLVNPAVLAAQARVARRIETAFDTLATDVQPRLDYTDVRDTVAALIQQLLANPDAAIFIDELADAGDAAMRHAATVCMLSLLIGLKLDDYIVLERTRLHAQRARDLTDLGIGAMLHDIGMLRIEPDALDRWNRRPDESDPAWRRHVLIGHEMVSGLIGPVAASAVLNHHQRIDGRGFPKRRRLTGGVEPVFGNDIHVFARIIAVADVFDRIRHSASAPGGETYGDNVIPTVRALRLMRTPKASAGLDPLVVKALFNVVPPYPPGSLVTLSDGRNAVVVDFAPDNPCRPTVEVLGDITADFRKARGLGERIALKRDPALHIAAIDGVDTAADNFSPDSPNEFDIRLAQRSLSNAAGPARRADDDELLADSA